MINPAPISLPVIRPIQETNTWRDRGLVGKLFTGIVRPGFDLYQKHIGDNLEFIRQAPEAARNLELILEHLAPMSIENPGHTIDIAWTVRDWRLRYTSASKLTADRDYHILATQEDAAVPFRPEEDTHYAHILPNIAQTARALAKTKRYKHRRNFRYLLGTIVELNKEAEEAYHAYPTKVPRNHNHNRLTLSIVQKYDPPLNCCPSLHIAYSWFIYNIAKHAGLDTQDTVAWEAIEQSTLGMIRAVTALKQHCLRDVAFGIKLAKNIFERRFKHDRFDDLTSHFDTLARIDPFTPYDNIRTVYHEIEHEDARIKNILGNYIGRHGFPKVAAGHPCGYFDEKTANIIPADR
ncbi:hypothetical protein C4580_00990 [Candidatus Woesearchaeota archaeon]|nr:MAG: hypothetical protein C4580_00990 [Candidatus Woesearchaeota archaeon]